MNANEPNEIVDAINFRLLSPLGAVSPLRPQRINPLIKLRTIGEKLLELSGTSNVVFR